MKPPYPGARFHSYDDDGNPVFTHTSSATLWACLMCHSTRLARRGVCKKCLATEQGAWAEYNK